MQFKKDFVGDKFFVPLEKRKKILLLSDDFRMPSGVGTMSKEIVLHTMHHFNWVQVGGAVRHPEKGKIIDMSHEMKRLFDLDTYIRIYPTDGYGNPDLIRWLINFEKPDAIMHFTDPRFWIWLYQTEHEIRQQVPLLFYHIWDDLPFPKYNEPYYDSCDWISCISKQTYNIVKQVCHREPKEPWQLKYIPHGINHKVFKPLSAEKPGDTIANPDGSITNEYEEMLKFKKDVFKDKEYDFVILYNNRNIRRKMTGDIILGYKYWVKSLPEEQQKKVVLLMHTTVVDENGTDLMAVAHDIAPDVNILFHDRKIEPKFMQYLYNLSDVTLNMASNEGFGLSSAESLMCGTPIINNVTGGLQDQMGFTDENGEYLDPDKHFNAEWGSNHDRRYRNHGLFSYPLWPTNRAMVGSPPTPYIFDDRANWEDIPDALNYWYSMSREKRKERGLLGRKYLFEAGMTAEEMGNRFINGIEEVFEKWTPRKRFSISKIEAPTPNKKTGIQLTK